MIYTLTLNPSLDYILQLDDLQTGRLNRVDKTFKFPGGKGINVSQVLKTLGIDSVTLGLIGGFTGDRLCQLLHKKDIRTDFIQVEEDTRINVKIKAQEETELNAKGPTCSQEKYQALTDQIKKLTTNDMLILSGSIPSTLPDTTYEQLAGICYEQGTPFVVDAEGDLLKRVLPYKPFLIKPNHHELGELFDTKVTTAEEAIPYGRKLIQDGAQHVLVSLAGNGAVLISKDKTFITSAPRGNIVGSVGAGDSMVAGFIAGYHASHSTYEAFKLSVAAGSATAFSNGLATEKMIHSLLSDIKPVSRGDSL
ncbi:6-phosphofructokinase [Lentibacillus sp. JNUCC-1]|uniref:1-phosphofructokinase n=1 Tax=Lentibacillus sp. JNUCC-1 TaxID=2654513 RepID=UPI0012E73E12|nr:1-phosphofructokinase [Lentibacillus sp. JNUCC-1]MUV36432.1 6-phosphofructokinase [Lentibacillus sp. JNUCC-1]